MYRTGDTRRVHGRHHRTPIIWLVGVLAFAVGVASAWPEAAVAKTHQIEMTAVETDVVVDGEGRRYRAWTFDGQFPGPVVRVTEGDTINFTLHNPKTNVYPHSMDFHAAEIDFLKNYRAINAGESLSYTFVARKPGVFFYHCGAPP
jgi:nitrite reductase (NO-forming)